MNEVQERGLELAKKVWTRAIELLGEEKKHLLQDCENKNVFCITTEEGYKIIIDNNGRKLNFTYINPKGEEMFYTTHNLTYNFETKIHIPTDTTRIKPIDDIMNYFTQAEKLELSKIELMYDNYSMDSIKYIADRYLGISETDFHMSTPCYICPKENETASLSTNVNNSYQITTSSIDNQFATHSILGNGLVINERVRYTKIQSFYLNVNLGRNKRISLNIKGSEYEFTCAGELSSDSRTVKISFGDKFHSQIYERIKEITIGNNISSLAIKYYNHEEPKDNDWDILSYVESPSNNNETKRYYQVTRNDESIGITLTESEVNKLTFHPTIKDFIFFIINMIGLKYPNIKDRLISDEYFGNPLYKLDKLDYEDDENIDSILGKKNCDYTTLSWIKDEINYIYRSIEDEEKRNAMIDALCQNMNQSTIEEINNYLKTKKSNHLVLKPKKNI